MTTFSPCSVGSVEMRASTVSPSTVSLARPSCGRRRSAMSSPDTILMRLTAAAVAFFGHGHDVAQQAVDAVADAQVAGLRLDVDVAGAGAHGVGEHDVDEAHDRRGLDRLLADLDVGRVVVAEALEQGVHVGGVLRQRPGAGQVVA